MRVVFILKWSLKLWGRCVITNLSLITYKKKYKKREREETPELTEKRKARNVQTLVCRDVAFGVQLQIITRVIVEMLSRTPGDTESRDRRTSRHVPVTCRREQLWLRAAMSEWCFFHAALETPGSVTATDRGFWRTIESIINRQSVITKREFAAVLIGGRESTFMIHKNTIIFRLMIDPLIMLFNRLAHVAAIIHKAGDCRLLNNYNNYNY